MFSDIRRSSTLLGAAFQLVAIGKIFVAIGQAWPVHFRWALGMTTAKIKRAGFDAVSGSLSLASFYRRLKQLDEQHGLHGNPQGCQALVEGLLSGISCSEQLAPRPPGD